MAHQSNASSFIPNFDRGKSTGGKSSFRLFQGSGIRRAFNNLRALNLAVFAE